MGFSIIVSGTENDRTENDRTAEPIQNSPVSGFCVLGSMGRYLCNKRDSWVPWVRSKKPEATGERKGVSKEFQGPIEKF